MVETRLKIRKDITLSEQLAGIIMDEIKTARPGYKVLPERKLAGKYSVSRKTVRSAIKIISEKGFLDRKVGKGSFVSEKIKNNAEIPSILLNFTEDHITVVSVKMVRNINKDKEILKVRHFYGNYSYVNSFLKLIENASGTGEKFDLICVDEGIIHYLAKKNLIVPLDELTEKSKVIKKEMFHHEVRRAFEYNGRLYGIPQFYSTIVIFYNKKLFDKYGIDYPDDGWNWNDLLETALSLTVKSTGTGKNLIYGFGFSPMHFNTIMPFIYQGVPKEQKLDENILRNGKIIEGLNFLYDLIYKYKVSPPLYNETIISHEKMFKTGMLAMFTGFYSSYCHLNAEPFSGWGMVRLPCGKREAVSVPVQGWAVSSESSVRKSFRAIEKIFASSNTAALTDELKRIPSCKIPQYKIPEIFIESLDNAVPSMKVFSDMELRKTFMEELLFLFNNCKTAENVVEKIKSCFDRKN